MKLFRGVVVPLLTPLQGDGRIDERATERYIEYLIGNGADGLFALSSTGEFCALSWESQRRYVEVIVHCAGGRVPVCAGVSSQCLAESIARSKELGNLGVDGVVALPPFYFRTSQSEMVEFFSAIADASPAPLLMYNMPFRTQHVIEPSTVETLCQHPNIAGLKDTVNDAERTRVLCARFKDHPTFSYLHGNELLAIEAGLQGADGCVPSLANLDPAFLAAVWKAAAAGDSQPSAEHQARMQSLMRAFSLLEDTPQSSTTLRLMALKAVLAELGIMEPHMAQLAPPMNDEWKRIVRAFVAEHALPGANVVADRAEAR